MEADDDFIFEVLLGLTGNVQATCGYWKKFSNDITARERVEHHGPPQLQVQARGGPERAPGRPWTAGAAPHDVGRTDITSQAHRAADSRAGKELELRAQLGPAQYEGLPDDRETARRSRSGDPNGFVAPPPVSESEEDEDASTSTL